MEKETSAKDPGGEEEGQSRETERQGGKKTQTHQCSQVEIDRSSLLPEWSSSR